jgi:uncharacterized protein
LKRTSFFVFLTLVFCPAVFALDVPEKPASYVNDRAGMMSPAAREALESKLAQFDKETSNQLVVATFESLEGGSLEDFSIRLAEKWRPGTAKKDNGVILLVFKQDREVRIEVGYGLEGAMPDALAKRIISNEIVPSFKAGDFDGGILNAAGAIMKATRGEYTADAAGEDPFDTYGPWAFIGLVLYVLLPLVLYAAVMIFMTAAGGAPGFFFGALIVAILAALRKMLASTVGQTISRGGTGGWYSGGGSGSFGGSSFGGFGGGSFGGGGASGRW